VTSRGHSVIVNILVFHALMAPPIAFAQTPIERVRQYSKDMAVTLEWFERVGYSPDIAGLEREFRPARSQSSPTGHAATRDQMGAETRGPMIDCMSYDVSCCKGSCWQ
jgi:hypothetical protein